MPPSFFPGLKAKLHSATVSEKLETQPRITAFPGILEFPCQNWDGVDFPYPVPSCTHREKAIWAGRAASKRFAHALETNNFCFLDMVDFAVAVFDKANEIIRYLARSAKECDIETTQAWIEFTDAVIARAFQIAYDTVAPRINDLMLTSKFTLANVYPFVRAAVNAQFEFGTGCADMPPSAAACTFDDDWVERYFPDAASLPARQLNMHEVDFNSHGAQCSIKVKVGWDHYNMVRYKTPSDEEQKRPIPHDREWPPLSRDGYKEYRERLSQQYARYGYRLSCHAIPH